MNSSRGSLEQPTEAADGKRVAAEEQSFGRLYQSVFNSARDPMLFLDSNTGTILDANSRACEVYGYSRDELRGAELSLVSDNAQLEFVRIQDAIKRGDDGFVAVAHKRRDGSQILFEMLPSVIESEEGWSLLCVNRDVTYRARNARELQHSLSLLESTLDSTLDGVLVTGPGGRTTLRNHAVAELLGVSSELLDSEKGDVIVTLFGHRVSNRATMMERYQQIVDAVDDASVDVVPLVDGRCFEVRSSPHRLAGQSVGRVWRIRDITEHRRAERAIRYAAFHDDLTGLPNRLLLSDRLEQALERARRENTFVGVLFVDLDRFKRINDTLGHSAGDELLLETTRRLLTTKRRGDTVARQGGDEFVIVAANMKTPQDAVTVAQRMLSSLEPPFAVDGHDLHVSASLGISVFPEHGNDAEALLKSSDLALYQAKAKGRGRYEVFESSMSSRAVDRLVIENELREALRDESFELRFQPQIELTTGRLVAVEALLRWRRKDGSITLPGDFIQIAEDCDLVQELGQWVIRTACQRSRDLVTQEDLRLAINVSPQQFRMPGFADFVCEAMRSAKLDPKRVELELTERAVMSNPEEGIAILQRLRKLGVGVAIDDFGTGYSSLSQLKCLPITCLKIARTFVSKCETDRQDRAIVAAIVRMAQSLDLRVVAEGVETAGQLAYLRSLGCDVIQGFYFFRPLELKTLQDRLAGDGPGLVAARDASEVREAVSSAGRSAVASSESSPVDVSKT